MEARTGSIRLVKMRSYLTSHYKQIHLRIVCFNIISCFSTSAASRLLMISTGWSNIFLPYPWRRWKFGKTEHCIFKYNITNIIWSFILHLVGHRTLCWSVIKRQIHTGEETDRSVFVFSEIRPWHCNFCFSSIFEKNIMGKLRSVQTLVSSDKTSQSCPGFCEARFPKEKPLTGFLKIQIFYQYSYILTFSKTVFTGNQPTVILIQVVTLTRYHKTLVNFALESTIQWRYDLGSFSLYLYLLPFFTR